MKILVTGSAGQLAQSLAERIAKRDDMELLAIGRPRLDLEQPGSAERIIAEIRPAVVINAAAFTAVDLAEDEPQRALRVNADAAGEIAAAAARSGARVIQISTDYVFDGRAREPYDETATTDPLNVYGRSKLAGERQVRAANPNHVIVRTAWLYAPFGQNFVKSIVAAAQAGRPLSVVDDQVGSPTSALDLADGLVAMLDDPAAGIGETFHLASRTAISRCEFARAIMVQCQKEGLPTAEIEPMHARDWPSKADRPAMSALSSAKFATIFGYSMPPLEHSLAQVIRRLPRHP